MSEHEIPTLEEVLKKLMLSFLVGMVIIVVFALQSSSSSQFISVAGVGTLIAVAIFFFGMLIGFIFGIPLSLSQGPEPLVKTTPKEMTTQEESPYQDNTNFDQISGWLTKILVGVGLIQLVKVPAALQEYSNNTAPSLGGFPSSGTFSVAILIFSLVDGFLVGYLWTRRRLPTEFLKGRYESAQFKHLEDKISQIDENLENRISKIDEKIDEIVRNDSEAIKLVNKLLNLSQDMPSVSEEELNEKIQKASDSARTQIYYSAENARKINWPNNIRALERTIPIFSALIKSDVEDKYHTNHGQLGIALLGLAFKNKDKPNRDYLEKARRELSEAILVRGEWNPQYGTHWLYYEFYRAICNISLDEEFQINKHPTTKPEVKEAILEDIKAAAKDLKLNNHMKIPETRIPEWITVNNLGSAENYLNQLKRTENNK